MKRLKRTIALISMVALAVTMSMTPTFAASSSKTIKAVKKTKITLTVKEKVKGNKAVVTLSWKKSGKQKMNFYQIYRKVGTGKYKFYAKTKNGKTMSFTDTKVTKGKKYTYKVRGVKKIKVKKKTKKYYSKWSAAKSRKVAGVKTPVKPTPTPTPDPSDPGIAKRELSGLKAVEIYSTMEGDEIKTDYIASPRELDEYHDIDIYKNAGVPYDISEVRVGNDVTGDKAQALYTAISDEVYAALIKEQGVLVAGSDSESTIGVAGAVRRAYPNAKVGIVYLDAQGDLAISETKIEGSGLSTIMGIDPNESKTSLWSAVSGGEAYDGLLLADGRAMTGTAGKNLAKVAKKAAYCEVLETEELNDADKWAKAVTDLADTVDVIVLHVDGDVLNHAYVSHMDAIDEGGPILWTVMSNIKAVMKTGKVAAVNLVNMYTEEKTTELTNHGFTIPVFPDETETETVNRLCSTSIMSGIRMISTALKYYDYMPEVPDGKEEVPATKKKTTNFDSMKIVEINTRNQTGGTLVGRRVAADPDSGYTYEDRGTVMPDKDNLFTDKVGTPREIDDWDNCGIYAQIGTDYEIDEIWLTNEQSDAKYPEYTRYEGLCREISDSVYEGAKEGKAIAVTGSGCMPTPAVAGGLRRAYGNDAKIGLIYIDAHGDINTVDSTFSGGIGGMDVAPTMGIDPHPTMQHWWEVCSDGMDPLDDLLHATGRDLDSGVDDHDPDNVYEFGEMINLKKATSDEKFILSVDEFNDAATFDAALADFAANMDVIYLHIDMDHVDGAFLPNAGTNVAYNQAPQYKGPAPWVTAERVKKIMETGKVGAVNLASTYGDETYKPERLLRNGFIYPVIEGEDMNSEYARNRANTPAILSGMRVLNSMLTNWTVKPAL